MIDSQSEVLWSVQFSESIRFSAYLLQLSEYWEFNKKTTSSVVIADGVGNRKPPGKQSVRQLYDQVSNRSTPKSHTKIWPT